MVISDFSINDELTRDEHTFKPLIKKNDFTIRVLKIKQSSFKSVMAFLLSLNEVIQLDLFVQTHYATEDYHSQIEIRQISDQICKFKKMKQLRTNLVYFGDLIGGVDFPLSLSELELKNQHEDSVDEKFTIRDLSFYSKHRLFDFNQFECLFNSQNSRFFEKLKIVFKFDCSYSKSTAFFNFLQEKVSFKYLHIIFKCTNEACLILNYKVVCRFYKLLTLQRENNYIALKYFYLNNLGIDSNLSKIKDSCFIRTDYSRNEAF